MSLSFSLSISLELERFANSRAVRGLEGGRRKKRGCEDACGGDWQLIPILDSGAAVWRAGAHFKTPQVCAPH